MREGTVPGVGAELDRAGDVDLAGVPVDAVDTHLADVVVVTDAQADCPGIVEIDPVGLSGQLAARVENLLLHRAVALDPETAHPVVGVVRDVGERGVRQERGPVRLRVQRPGPGHDRLLRVGLAQVGHVRGHTRDVQRNCLPQAYVRGAGVPIHPSQVQDGNGRTERRNRVGADEHRLLVRGDPGVLG